MLNADNLIENDRHKLDKIVTNIESITENLLSITDSIYATKISSVLDNVNSAVVSLDSILKKVDNSEGNLGLLLNDSKLYNNLTESTKNLNELIEDIKKNPKKYINVKVF